MTDIRPMERPCSALSKLDYESQLRQDEMIGPGGGVSIYASL
jgi:hypothetical protein